MASVLVRPEMKPEAEGGHHSFFTEGYAPYLVAAGTSQWLAVRVIECPELVWPGSAATIHFEFLYPLDIDYDTLQTGTQVDMLEGRRVVATGLILLPPKA